MAVAAVLLVAAAPASAAAPATWTQKADEIAAPWPGLQQENGSFRDYVLTRDPTGVRDDYGDAILGYGLLLTAARNGDAKLADSGLRALELALDRAARSPSTQVFHQLATTSAYNLARRRFADHPVFQRARSRWEDMLREIEIYRLGRQKVTNKSIVEAILLLELIESGQSSGAAAMRAAVLRFLGSELPEAAKPYRGVLGDMPLLPPAYHALSVGMLKRTLDLLGADAPAAARTLLRRAAAASEDAAAPDGDVAYHGRSQAQAWTLPLTAYGAPRLAERTVARLVAAYPNGPEGLLVTPSLTKGIEAALPGVDEYMAGASYTGLTLMALEWAIAAHTETAAAPDTGAHVLGGGSGAWATSRRGDVWFAVKRTRTSNVDLRYGFGLVALKVRRDGGWTDLMPPPPRTVRGFDSAGPALLGSDKGFPEGTELRLGRKGAAVIRGGFRTRSGRWLRRGVTFTFTPTRCGVRLTFTSRPGDRFELSTFFRGDPARSGRAIRDAEQSVVFDGTPKISWSDGFASGSDIDLMRARAGWKPSGRSASVEICPS